MCPDSVARIVLGEHWEAADDLLQVRRGDVELVGLLSNVLERGQRDLRKKRSVLCGTVSSDDQLTP